MAGQLIAVKLEAGSRTLCNHREKHKHMLREKPSVSQLIVSSNPALFYVTERACSDLCLPFIEVKKVKNILSLLTGWTGNTLTTLTVSLLNVLR